MTPLRRYHRADELVSVRDCVAGTTRYYHYDHQGTTQALTDKSGAVTDRFASDAFGVQVKRTGTSINRNWYVGNSGYYRQVDRMLDYTAGGILSPSLGRWIRREQDAYLYEGNAPSSLLTLRGRVLANSVPTAGAAPRVRLDFWSTPGNPFVFSPCGGAAWTIRWAIHNLKGDPLDKETVCGFVIQKVTVRSAGVETCNPSVPIPPALSCLPDSLIYYEAWPFRHEPDRKPEKVIFDLPNADTFGFAFGRNVPTPNRGQWEICGDAIFVEMPCPVKPFTDDTFRPPGSWWRSGASCAQLGPCGNWRSTNWCSFVAPPGFASDRSSHVRRRLRIEWECGCGPNCTCVRCGGAYQIRANPIQRRFCNPRGTCGEDGNMALCDPGPAGGF